MFGFGCVEEDTNQDQEELVVIYYFVGTQKRLRDEASRNRSRELLFVRGEIGRVGCLCLMDVLSQGKQKVTLEDETKFFSHEKQNCSLKL
jgi:hypothetical protein